MAGTLLDRFPWFPISRDQLTMLMEGNICDGSKAFRDFNINPIPFSLESLNYLKGWNSCTSSWLELLYFYYQWWLFYSVNPCEICYPTIGSKNSRMPLKWMVKLFSSSNDTPLIIWIGRWATKLIPRIMNTKKVKMECAQHFCFNWETKLFTWNSHNNWIPISFQFFHSIFFIKVKCTLVFNPQFKIQPFRSAHC